MQEIVKYSRCFVCGDQNVNGLKARFFYDGDQAVASIVAESGFEGYRGILHGGIIYSMLDEVMIKALLADGIYAVTAEMTIRYHSPVSTGQELRFVGSVVSRRRRMYQTKGKASGPDGTIFASATAKYIEARPEFKSRLLESLDSD